VGEVPVSLFEVSFCVRFDTSLVTNLDNKRTCVDALFNLFGYGI